VVKSISRVKSEQQGCAGPPAVVELELELSLGVVVL
jgi:hypothetical protein